MGIQPQQLGQALRHSTKSSTEGLYHLWQLGWQSGWDREILAASGKVLMTAFHLD